MYLSLCLLPFSSFNFCCSRHKKFKITSLRATSWRDVPRNLNLQMHVLCILFCFTCMMQTSVSISSESVVFSILNCLLTEIRNVPQLGNWMQYGIYTSCIFIHCYNFYSLLSPPSPSSSRILNPENLRKLV